MGDIVHRGLAHRLRLVHRQLEAADDELLHRRAVAGDKAPARRVGADRRRVAAEDLRRVGLGVDRKGDHPGVDVEGRELLLKLDHRPRDLRAHARARGEDEARDPDLAAHRLQREGLAVLIDELKVRHLEHDRRRVGDVPCQRSHHGDQGDADEERDDVGLPHEEAEKPIALLDRGRSPEGAGTGVGRRGFSGHHELSGTRTNRRSPGDGRYVARAPGIHERSWSEGDTTRAQSAPERSDADVDRHRGDQRG